MSITATSTATSKNMLMMGEFFFEDNTKQPERREFYGFSIFAILALCIGLAFAGTFGGAGTILDMSTAGSLISLLLVSLCLLLLCYFGFCNYQFSNLY